MFFDGDSLVNTLIVNSFRSGAAQDWAMSPVLFIPELIVYGLISLFADGPRTALTINAIVNFVALYGALRIASGSRKHSHAPVITSLLAFAAFCALVLLEENGGRDSMQLAGLLATTTYYSATVIAAVATVGLIRRAFDARRVSLSVGISIGVTAMLSTLSNPLFTAWATAPALVLLFVMGIFRGQRRVSSVLALLLVTVTVVALTGRAGLGRLIGASIPDYFHPEDIAGALEHLVNLASGELARPGAIAGSVLIAALLATAIVMTVKNRAAKEAGAWVLALYAWFAPLSSVIGVFMLGLPSPRYLQPLVVAPMLILMSAAASKPRWISDHLTRRLPTPGLTVTLLVCAVLSGAGVLRLLAPPASEARASLQCAVDWVEKSERHGAGQFWSVRAPKSYVSDPASLLQVTSEARPYEWMVNRSDYDTESVTFLLLDDQSYPFSLPNHLSVDDADRIDCGRYVIFDFGEVNISTAP